MNIQRSAGKDSQVTSSTLQALPFAAEGKEKKADEPPHRKKPKKPAPADSERRDDAGSASPKNKLDHELDEELEESFPANDPPSLTQEPH
ncbi:MAG TPA: hypothetical protein VFY39_11295 [Gammaproteobacteria bacterium]|nr:hypothetical protein [Gammaproteobacteria bacterium]